MKKIRNISIYFIGELSILRLGHLCLTVALLVHAVYETRRHLGIISEREEQSLIASTLEEISEIIQSVRSSAANIESRTGGQE